MVLTGYHPSLIDPFVEELQRLVREGHTNKGIDARVSCVEHDRISPRTPNINIYIKAFSYYLRKETFRMKYL